MIISLAFFCTSQSPLITFEAYLNNMLEQIEYKNLEFVFYLVAFTLGDVLLITKYLILMS
jgi:hypothetical protein